MVDDHKVFRMGIAECLADESDMKIAGEAGSGEDAIRLIREHEFDVVLLDIAMPGRGGIATLRQIREMKPELRVLVLSAFPESHYAVNMLRAGAHGYLWKNCDPKEIVHAIRTVHRGHRYLSTAAADMLSDKIRSETDRPLHESLSAREFEVFHKLAAGATLTSIAVELRLSIKTVSTYRTRVLEKLGLQSNADLTQYAIYNGLLN